MSQDVLLALSGPLIAALAVLVTQLLANRREDRRVAAERTERAAERDVEGQRRMQERQDALDSTWREERRAIYARLASVIDQASMLARAYLEGASPPEFGPTDSLPLINDLSALRRESVPAVMADLLLIASDDAQKEAAALQDDVRIVVGLIFDTENLRKTKKILGAEQESRFNASLVDFKSAIGEMDEHRRLFLAAARRDLGTS